MKTLDENDKKCNKEILIHFQNSRILIKAKNYILAKVTLENCLKNKESTMDISIKNEIYFSLGFCNFYLHKFIDSQGYFLKALDTYEVYINNYNTEKGIFSK